MEPRLYLPHAAVQTPLQFSDRRQGDNMSWLKAILGGVIGAEALNLVKEYVEKRGGVEAVVGRLRNGARQTRCGEQQEGGGPADHSNLPNTASFKATPFWPPAEGATCVSISAPPSNVMNPRHFR